MRRFLTSLLCALVLLSHGGLVAAHTHGSDTGVEHIGGLSLHADDHRDGPLDDHALAYDHDDHQSDDGNPASSTGSHSHAAVDGVPRAPEAPSISVVMQSVQLYDPRYLDPPSTVIAPGLEPPTA